MPNTRSAPLHFAQVAAGSMAHFSGRTGRLVDWERCRRLRGVQATGVAGGAVASGGSGCGRRGGGGGSAAAALSRISSRRFAKSSFDAVRAAIFSSRSARAASRAASA